MRLGVRFGWLGALTVSVNAYASPSARLVYARSPEAASCPDETALRKAVSARFGYDPFFAWAKQTVVVQISRDHARYTARVQLVDDQGLARGNREISSNEEACSELFDAAALAISIALDAAAQMPRPPSPEVNVAPAAPQGPPILEPALPMPPGPPAAEALSEPPAKPRGPRLFRIGIDGGASAGLAPNPTPELAAFADIRTGRLTLGVELRGDMALPSTLALGSSFPQEARVQSTLLAATFAPCIHYGAGFVCVLATFGRLQAWSDLRDPHSEAVFFAAAGGRMGLEWPLSESFFLRFRGELVADLERPSFQLDSQTPWTAPPFAGTLAAGIGARLP